MKSGREFRATVAIMLATILGCPPAEALVALNDGHDRIFVTGSAGMSYDSNVFANRDGKGDYAYNTGFTAEYTRRAGWIGVNGSVAISGSHYATIKGIDFTNPTFSFELNKQSGRTTGAFTLNVARESRADAAVNLRSTSWSYTPGLNIKYPITGTYTLAANFGYAARKYVDETILTNLSTYSANFDLYHVLTQDRDMSLGYRYRFAETSAKSHYTDHGINLGLSGKIIRGLNGGFQLGYQTRVPSGSASVDPKYGSWTAAASVSHTFTKKLSLHGNLSKDLSITGTDASVDTTSAGLDLAYAFSSRMSLSATTSWGDSRFLGERGREVIALGPPLILGRARRDDYYTWSLGTSYSLNEHLSGALGYTWFHNWSTTNLADFVRNSWTASLSSHW
jgi:hypothetical protein